VKQRHEPEHRPPLYLPVKWPHLKMPYSLCLLAVSQLFFSKELYFVGRQSFCWWMEHPIVTHLLNRHHGLPRNCCESLTRSFDGYFDGILIRLIIGQKSLLYLHLWVGMPLASSDTIDVYLLAIMVLMRWHDIEVNFIGRKARIRRMHMDCLNNRLTTFHLNYSLTDRILSCV
jgi:hypothetical protein